MRKVYEIYNLLFIFKKHFFAYPKILYIRIYIKDHYKSLFYGFNHLPLAPCLLVKQEALPLLLAIAYPPLLLELPPVPPKLPPLPLKLPPLPLEPLQLPLAAPSPARRVRSSYPFPAVLRSLPCCPLVTSRGSISHSIQQAVRV